jgi:putative FmdB family regulatory protein
MPIYEYICKQCGREIEIFQNTNEPAPGCAHCLTPMKKQLGLCLVYFGRRNSYTRRGYENSNVILRGSDGRRVMEQSRMRPGQTRLDRQMNSSKGDAKFASDNGDARE